VAITGHSRGGKMTLLAGATSNANRPESSRCGLEYPSGLSAWKRLIASLANPKRADCDQPQPIARGAPHRKTAPLRPPMPACGRV